MAQAPTQCPTSRRTSPKSPPPPKLKLDEFKPIFPTTATNTSTSSSSKSGTAFVFTSSRTTRSGFSSPSTSPATPPSSPLADPRYPSKSRPILSYTQLARHSQGALDARCIVGPNMRAAGFVPLAHNLAHPRSQSLSSIVSDEGEPSSPSPSVTSGVPTPSEPPPFPAIMFVSPSQMTGVSPWHFQRQGGWGVSQGKSVADFGPASSRESTLDPPFEPTPSLSSAAHPRSHISTPSLSSVMSTASTSASILSPIPTSSSMSSLPSIDSNHMLGKEHSGSKSALDVMQAKHFHSSTPPMDGYPFPHTPPRSTGSSPPSNSSSSTGISAYTTATEHSPASAVSRSPAQILPASVATVGPSTVNPVLPSRPLAIPLQKEDKRPPSFRQAARILQDERGNRSRSRSAGLSLTELCETSSRAAWVTDPNVFGPFDTIPHRSGSTPNSVSGSSSSGRGSRGRSRASSVIGASDRATARERRKDSTDLTSELANLNLVMESVKEESLEKESPTVEPQDDAAKDREWARFRDADRKRRKGKERRRNKTDSDSEGKGEAGKGHARTSADKQPKTRAHAQAHSFSSFSFPPGPSKPTAPHVLGEHGDGAPKAEPRERNKKSSTSRERREREREHHRGKDLGALVQAHRLHDREQAKQSERENRGREKQRAIAANDSKYDTLDQNITWEKSYEKHSRSFYQTKPRSGDQRLRYLGDLTIDGETVVDLETRV